MKFLCLILSIYIFSLVAFPCHDADGMTLTQTTEKSTTHNQDEQDCHSCSPFCVCNCCQINVLTVLVFIPETYQAITATLYTSYKEFPSKEMPNSIWQPPKNRS